MKNLGKPKQQGFSLIEVLVAGLVITLGLVAMVMLQVRSQNQAFATHQRSLIGLYSQDMQERLRANLCFLSSGQGHEHLSDFISTKLSGFLSDLDQEWRSDHFTGAQSGWTSSLVADFQNETDQAGKVINDGYWRFTLTITPTAPMTGGITQSLLVDYWSGVCK